MTKKKAPEPTEKEKTVERHEFDACLKVISALSNEIAPLVEEKIRTALAPLGEFNVHRSEAGPGKAALYIFIEDMSAYRLGGTVSLDLKTDMWRERFKPSTSRHKSDHMPHAGRFVLGGTETRSLVQISATNADTLDTLDLLHRTMLFTRALRDAELYIDTLVSFRVTKLGEAFTQALKGSPDRNGME